MAWPEPPDYYEKPKHGYKLTLYNPVYPVINPEPSIPDAVVNMRTDAWGIVAGMAAVGYIAGYYYGSKVHAAKGTALFTSVFFGKTGMLWGMADSANRLMGYRENGREVAKHMPGMLSKEAY